MVKRNEHMKKVVQFSQEGKRLKTFASISEASEKTGASMHSITRSCTAVDGHTLGGDFVWRFSGEVVGEKRLGESYVKRYTRPLVRLRMDFSPVDRFTDVREAVEKVKRGSDDVTVETLLYACFGYYTQVGGYRYMFEEDYKEKRKQFSTKKEYAACMRKEEEHARQDALYITRKQMHANGDVSLTTAQLERMRISQEKYRKDLLEKMTQQGDTIKARVTSLKDGVVVKHYESSIVAAKEFNVRPAEIACCALKVAGFISAGGFQWELTGKLEDRLNRELDDVMHLRDEDEGRP